MNEHDQAGAEQRESDRIRDDIDRTLCEMDDTVTQLQAQMRPRALLKRAGSAMLSPGGVIGLGVAWLVIDRLSGRGRHERYEVGRRAHAPGAVSRGASYARDKIESAAEHAREKASELSHRAGDALRSARDSVSDFGDRVSERAGETAHAVRERASHAAQAVQRSAVRAGEQVTGLYEENPLALGAVALAAGVVGGLVLPSTRREDELLGPARDRLVGQARQIGRDVAQVGKEVVQTATQAAKDQAQRSDGRPPALRAADAIGRGVEAGAQQAQQRIDRLQNPD